MTFVATRNKGFAMTFENGFGISVQWGTENYCEKKSFNTDTDPMEHDRWESLSAEIAIYKDQKFIDVGDDQVIGWLSPDEVAKVIEIVATAHTDIEIQVKLEVEKIIK